MKLLCFLVVSCLLSASLTAGESSFVLPTDPHLVIQTDKGDIEVRLFPATAPKAVENFIRLAQQGFYNNTVFHRVVKGFVIQGGDPTATGRGGQSVWGTNFEDEIDPKIKFDRPGLLAMANSGPKTNGSQFFITVREASWLDGKHTIFGEVVKGYDVVQAINSEEYPQAGWFAESTTTPVTVQRVYLR